MADISQSLPGWSTTASSNAPAGTTAIGSGLDDNLRAIQATVRQFLASQGTNIASAATIDLSLADGYYISITGSTGPVTSLGTVAAGISYWLSTVSTPTFTHNGTSLILPGAANITAVAGDVFRFTSLGSGNWRCTLYLPANGYFPATVGTQTVWVPATAMTSRTTNGPSSGTVESSTNKVMSKTLDFDSSTNEFAQFNIRMPKSWNEGGMQAEFYWSSLTATGDCVWAVQAVSLSDLDLLDTAFGTAVTATDTSTTASGVLRSTITATLTSAGTPAVGDITTFQVYRDASAAGDTLAVDARLHGVALFFTTDAPTDA